jgi:hypothetical protein
VAMLPFNFAVLRRLLPGALPRALRAVVPSYLSGAVFLMVLLAFRLWGGDHLSVAVISTILASLLYILLVRRSDPGFEELLRRQVVGLRTA